VKGLKVFKRFYSIQNALNILFIAGHKLHTFFFAYLLNQQTFGQSGGYLGRRKDPSPVAPSAFHSSSCPKTHILSQQLYLP